MNLHVAVCIVGYRNSEDIAECLGALQQSRYADFEVVICENGGEEAHGVLVRALSGIQVGGGQPRIILAPGNLGYAGGVNVCIENSRHADAWWVLNPDTIPNPDALGALVEALVGGEYDAVAALMHSTDGIVESCGGRWRPWLGRAESIGRGKPLNEPIDVRSVVRDISYIPGGSMLVSRRFVETVGLMREDYFLYCEEVEWSLRARELGMRLGFTPHARIAHNQGSTTGSNEEMKRRPKLPIYLDERNKLLVQRDRFSGRLPVSAAATFALILLRYARRGAWPQLGYALQGWAAGLANKRGVPAWLTRASGR
jgi:GT2 family glycosyltransferase